MSMRQVENQKWNTPVLELKRSGFSSTKELDKYALYNQRLHIMYQTPSSLDLANIHKTAVAFGYNPPYPAGFTIPLCPCCLLPVNTQPLGLNASTTPFIQDSILTEPFYLNEGVSLFFTFIKFSIIYLFILFLTVSIFSLSMSLINDQYCKLRQSQCGTSSFIKYSPVKQGMKGYIHYLHITDYLNLAVIILLIVFFRYYRKYHQEIHDVLKMTHQSQEDFTLIVKNIPHIIHSTDNSIHFNYEQALKGLFEQKILEFFMKEIQLENRHQSLLQSFNYGVIGNNKIDPSQLDIVKSISLCFDLTDLKKLAKFRDELVEELPQHKQQETSLLPVRESMMHPNNKLTIINQQYLQLCKSFCVQRNLTWTLTRFLGIAFVSLEFQHYRNYLLQLYQNNSSEFTINNTPLTLALATKPQNIEWFNLSVQESERIKSTLISYLVIFFMLLLSFFLLASLQASEFPVKGRQASPFNQPTTIKSTGHHLLIAGIIYTVNYILRKVISYLTSRERHQAKTKRFKSTVIKCLLAHFINTTGIYFILSLLEGQHYLREDGIVVETSYYVIFMGIASLIFNILNLDQKVQALVFRFFCSNLPQSQVQINFNKSQEYPQFDFASRYSYYLTLLYLVLFFSYINPLCVPTTIILFFLHYWIDKYNLFKRSSMTLQLSYGFSTLILKLLQLSLVLLAGGNLFYSWKLYKQCKLINVIALGLACLYVLLANCSPRSLERVFCGRPHTLQSDSYSNCILQGKFHKTYWLTNPATMFTEQPDINHKGSIIDYRTSYRLAHKQDISRYHRE